MAQLGVLGTARPFLRWAGSKRWLSRAISALVPAGTAKYYEPFLGSGAVYFSLAESIECHLSDTLSPLIACYAEIQRDAEAVATQLQRWNCDRDTYYEVRSLRPDVESTEAAAQFIYLNRLGFNGLYRVNSSGGFNVPYGRPKNANMVTLAELRLVANRLKDVTTLKAQDFEDALDECDAEDFVYLDPPYVAGHRNNGFVDYNAKLFTWSDQERLARKFQDLSAAGIKVVLSNADHESVRSLYAKYRVITIERHSSMAARASARGKTQEILVLSDALRGYKWHD